MHMKWTSNDIADLRRLYPIASWTQIEARFPYETRNAIQIRASRHRLKRPKKHAKPPIRETGTHWKREPWQTPEIVKRLYQLLVIADDEATRLNQPYDRINVINAAIELIREGK